MVRALHSKKQTVFTPLFLLTGLTIGCSLPFNPPAMAQIVPDNSLGNESSIVVPNQNIRGIESDRIDGGAIRGSNLFHSFQEFNIDNGRGAYFSNPENITNILTRVTGNNLSNILGTLGVLGNANLFLINPNGIVFGPNARLDVGGSFFASTADGILFENGVEFAASNPDAPPLLTINIPIGLNFRDNPGSIVNQSIAVDSEDNFVGLQVLPQKTLGLVGGNISLERGNLSAPQGRIELGSVAGNSRVNLTPIEKGYTLNYENVPNFQDIVLSQEAFVDVRGEGGGDLQIQGRRVTLTDGSVIEASTQGSEPGGLLTIQASESVEVVGSGIFADLDPGATGMGGNIIIDTQRLLVSDGGFISASTFGNGDGGNLTITADDVEVIGSSADDQFPSIIAVEVGPEAVGNAGNLTIDTQRLSVRDGAQVTADTFGNGNAANVQLRASESIEIAGSSSRRPTFVVADVDPEATGQGGNLTIETKRLSIRDGAQVATSTFGTGNAGNLTVRADEVEIFGRAANGSVRPVSGLFSSSQSDNGSAGNLTIEAIQVSVRDGAVVSASTFGAGNGGNLMIKAEQLNISDSGQVEAATSGAGDGGNLTIEVRQLTAINSGEVSASTFSTGDAGNVIVRASEIDLSGTSADASSSSSIRTQVNDEATGNGGNLIIETERLILQDGAKVSASAQGEGQAGNLTINASDSVEVIGRSPKGRTTPSAIFARTEGQTEGAGDGGDLTITTGRLIVRNGGQVSASTFGRGNAGNLTVRASEFVELNGISPFGSFPGGLFASTNSDSTGQEGAGDGGNLTIITGRLIVRNGAQVNATTSGNGDGGNLNVTATDVKLVGTSTEAPSGLFTSAEPDSTGQAGILIVNTDNLTVQDGAVIGVRSVGTEAAGDLIINAPNIFLDNQARLNGETTAGEGDIILNTEDLRLRRNSRITTNATGEATGGNITINTETLTALENSDISANAEDAFGGRVTINAIGVFGTAFREQQTRFSDITATSELGPEFSGTVELNTELDPSSGLIDLTQTVVDPNDLIAQEFCRQRGGSEFIVTGKGGLAADPNDKADGNQIEVDLVEPVPSRPRTSAQQRSQTEDNQPISSLDIVPARGWIRDENGDVILVSYDPTKTGVQRQPSQLPQCQP